MNIKINTQVLVKLADEVGYFRVIIVIRLPKQKSTILPVFLKPGFQSYLLDNNNISYSRNKEK